MIVAVPAVDPDLADPAVVRDIRPYPGWSWRCAPPDASHADPAPVALRALVDGPPSALRGLALVRAPASVRLALARVVRVV